MVKYRDNKYDISFGTIMNIDINREELIYQIDSGQGSTGAPILNLNTFKVFGMHQTFNEKLKEKYGSLLYFPVNKFIGKFNSNQDYA